MRIAWILGWAVPEAWFAPLVRTILPSADHRFFAASPNWLAQVCADGPWDVIAGHSLGTLLMLKEADSLSRLAPNVVLFAPVFAFPREQAMGGRMGLAQIKYLAGCLKADRAAGLAQYYLQAGLTGCAVDDAPCGLLQWGLEKLADDWVEPPMPAGWRSYVGSEDTLLDAEELRQIQPLVIRVAGGTHHPEALIRAWAESLAELKN